MTNYKLYTWVVIGKRRTVILKSISATMTAMQICKQSRIYNKKISINNTCDFLRNAIEIGLVYCTNPEVKKKLYKLTQEGEEIRNELLKEL